MGLPKAETNKPDSPRIEPAINVDDGGDNDEPNEHTERKLIGKKDITPVNLDDSDDISEEEDDEAA